MIKGGKTLPNFLLKLFVSRPKRFRHTACKTKTKPTKNNKNTKSVKKKVRKILICVGIFF